VLSIISTSSTLVENILFTVERDLNWTMNAYGTPMPSHGVVWISSHQCPAIIMNQEIRRSHISCLLISKNGFELNNACNLKYSEVEDASSTLIAFRDNPDSIDEGCNALALSIGVAVLKAATSILEMCPKNTRGFPWEILVPDLCLMFPFIKTTTISPKEAFCEAYKNISELFIIRDAIGYVEEVYFSDDYKIHPTRYHKKKTISFRADVSRRAQSSLRGHVMSASEAPHVPRFT
jgi:hypothetical protein